MAQMCVGKLVPDECAAIFTRPEDGSIPSLSQSDRRETTHDEGLSRRWLQCSFATSRWCDCRRTLFG